MAKKATKKTAQRREEITAPEGFEELARAWWDAVNEIHELLLRGESGLDLVGAAYATELKARWEYARALHVRGYQVPEYLAERAIVAPPWPLPEPPALAGKYTEAA